MSTMICPDCDTEIFAWCNCGTSSLFTHQWLEGVAVNIPLSVVRYDLNCEDGIPHMREYPEGAYVRYSDVTSAQVTTNHNALPPELLRRIRERLKAERDEADRWRNSRDASDWYDRYRAAALKANTLEWVLLLQAESTLPKCGCGIMTVCQEHSPLRDVAPAQPTTNRNTDCGCGALAQDGRRCPQHTAGSAQSRQVPKHASGGGMDALTTPATPATDGPTDG